MYGSPNVVGTGKRCREHRLRGNGVQATTCHRSGETVYGSPDVAGAGKRCREHHLRGHDGVEVTTCRRHGEYREHRSL